MDSIKNCITLLCEQPTAVLGSAFPPNIDPIIEVKPNFIINL